jgi:hypothetical protein
MQKIFTGGKISFQQGRQKYKSELILWHGLPALGRPTLH